MNKFDNFREPHSNEANVRIKLFYFLPSLSLSHSHTHTSQLLSLFISFLLFLHKETNIFSAFVFEVKMLFRSKLTFESSSFFKREESSYL